MAPPYDIPENVTNFIDLFNFGNEVTSPEGYHYLGDIVIIIIWIITWAVFSVSSRERPQIKSFMVSSYTAFFLAVIMDIVSLIDDMVLAMTLAGLVISIVIDKILEN